jgi:hypothetical protein
MQKIPTLFLRNFDVKPVVITDEVNPECQWVLDGEGQATEKYDGTCCLMRGGLLYRRYNYKRGREPSDGWIPAQPSSDETGNWPGWILVDFRNPADKWHLDALAYCVANGIGLADGTYELVGPKVNSNPYGQNEHHLWWHGADYILIAPLTFEGIRTSLEHLPVEGVVWHHEDGRMAKLKRKDFGFDWPKKRGESGQ